MLCQVVIFSSFSAKYCYLENITGWFFIKKTYVVRFLEIPILRNLINFIHIFVIRKQ